MSAACRITPNGLVLRLRVIPNAGGDRLEGEEIRADGSVVLKLRVAAIPDRGKANAAVLGLLAKALGLPRSALRVTAGATARLKTVEIAGDGTELTLRLDRLIGAKLA